MTEETEKLEALMKGIDAMGPLLDVSKGMIAKLMEAGFTQEDASRIITEMIIGSIKNAAAEAAEATKTKGQTPGSNRQGRR